MQTARSRDSRRPCDVRSRPSTIDDSAEVQHSPYNRVSEREIDDTDIQRLSESEEKFYRHTLLCKRVLRQYSWIGGEADSGLKMESEARRETARVNATVRSFTIAPTGGFHQTTRFAGGI